MRSHQCIGYKHHYDECVERVQAQHENPEHKGHKEDCVEECTSAPFGCWAVMVDSIDSLGLGVPTC